MARIRAHESGLPSLGKQLDVELTAQRRPTDCRNGTTRGEGIC